MFEEFYLGIDGGQSHTEAVIADCAGNIKGRGRGGPSNHAEQPGGRERLQRAIVESVGSALRRAVDDSNSMLQRDYESLIGSTRFAAAHCAMTGGADFKEEAIGEILQARVLKIGHDAPAALTGATGGEPGIVIIAGTGSVAYGEKADGTNLRVGGWGHLFGDEGSGFWIATEAVRRAIWAEDVLAEEATVLGQLALEYFGQANLRSLALAIYSEDISRDRFASFAERVHQAAVEGDRVACAIVELAGRSLALLVATVAERLQLTPDETRVACVGGVLRGALAHEAFASELKERLPSGHIIAPRFDPAIGALLLAYRADERSLTDELLMCLEKQVITGTLHGTMS